MTQRILRLYGWIFALTGLVFVAGSGELLPLLDLGLAWIPGAKPLLGREPSLWLALAGSLMSVLAALSFALARDPERELAWTLVILSKAASTGLCAVFALELRNPALLLGSVVDGSILLHFLALRGCSRSSASLTFRPRFPHRDGPFYEVWFAKVNDPVTRSALWVRYTLERGAAGERASCWYVLFDARARKISSGKLEADLAKAAMGPESPFLLGGARVEPGRLRASGDGFAWDLAWKDGAAPGFSFMPPALWGVLPSGYAVPVSAGRFTGSMTVGGTTLAVSDAPGSIGHLWGPNMAREWRWAHAIFDDGTVFEILSARVHGAPTLTTANLWRKGRHHRSVGVLTGLRNESRRDGERWVFRADFGEFSVDGECGAPADMTIALPYASPDGREVVCRNSKTGFMKLSLPDGEASTPDSAAVEFAGPA